MGFFEIVCNDFFKALTGKYRNVFADCLDIIYDSYKTELSYGIDKEKLVMRLSDYFENSDCDDIRFEDEDDVYKDPRSKANEFLRKLRAYGWIEYEFANDGSVKIIMPDYSVTIMQALRSITDSKETEYQSEVSAIYSLLINDELYDRPYPQIIRPVYERTITMFTGLKKLNTNIKKYIDEITENMSAEEIMEHFLSYDSNIGSKAYHRLKTNENVSRFRNTIESRLRNILNNEDLLERAVLGYQNTEGENDKVEARDKVIGMITDVIGHFSSYDEIEKEIERKHTKYIKSAVNRAKFAFMSTNNIEGKLTTVMRGLALFGGESDDDTPDEYYRIFNLFPQGYISAESLSSSHISRKIANVDEIQDIPTISAEESARRRASLKEKYNGPYSKKTITGLVNTLLKNRREISASEIPINTKHDFIQLILIGKYARDRHSEYLILPKEESVTVNGFTFRDFIVKKRVK